MRAVLVFCEGEHDVVFITRSLGRLGGCTWVSGPIDQLPTPFGSNGPRLKSLIVQRYMSRELGGQHLRAAAHTPLPTFDVVVEHPASGTLYVILRSDADRSTVGVDSVLGDLEAIWQLEQGRVDIDRVATALVFDADDEGVSHRSARIRELYSPTLGEPVALDHGQWSITRRGPVGLFFFHDPATQRGTLESLLGPTVESTWPGRWTGAGAFIDEHASTGDKVRRNMSEEIKARITIAGQLQCPGDPMSVVLRHDGLPHECFMGPHSQRLVDFLLAVPWT